MNRAGIVASIVLALPVLLSAQTKVPTQFDVLLVKPSKVGNDRMSLQWTSSGWKTANLPLEIVIAFSNGVEPRLVFGLPPWAQTARWDIEGKIVDTDAKPMDKLSKAERNALMLSALRDRFGMVAHREDKVQPVFTMTVQPDGPKFRQSPPLPEGTPEPKFGRTRWTLDNNILRASSVTMAQLAETLSARVGRNVVDATGLKGAYDFQFDWPPQDGVERGDNGKPAEAGPSVFEILREQLGLKLTSDKAPVPTVVVDTIAKPEEN